MYLTIAIAILWLVPYVIHMPIYCEFETVIDKNDGAVNLFNAAFNSISASQSVTMYLVLPSQPLRTEKAVQGDAGHPN
jgi:hypothetical protein